MKTINQKTNMNNDAFVAMDKGMFRVKMMELMKGSKVKKGVKVMSSALLVTLSLKASVLAGINDNINPFIIARPCTISHLRELVFMNNSEGNDKYMTTYHAACNITKDKFDEIIYGPALD